MSDPGVEQAVIGEPKSEVLAVLEAESGVGDVGVKFLDSGWLGWVCTVLGRMMRLTLGFVMMLFRNWGNDGCRTVVATSTRAEG